LLPQLVQLVSFEIELFLHRHKVLLNFGGLLFLLLQFHLQLSLLFLLLRKLLTRFLELLLLRFGDFHDLRAHQHLLFHLLKLLDEFLLFRLCLLLLFFLLLEFFEKFLLFFLLEIGLVLNILSLLF